MMTAQHDPFGTYIATLTYRVNIGGGAVYEAHPEQHETDEGLFELSSSQMIVTMKKDYPTPVAARHAIQPTIDAWHAMADREMAPDEFRLRYDTCTVAHRAPPPSGTIVVGSGELTMGGDIVQAFATVLPPKRNKFPTFPTEFKLTDRVKLLRDRFELLDAGADQITSAAYYFLTAVEGIAEKKPYRRNAAKGLGISLDVLSKLAELSSTHGGRIGRKAHSTAELTGAQTHWLRETMKAIFFQFGAYEAGASLRRIEMSDLPPL